MDLCTRKIVGWSLNHRMPAELVVSALEMAIGKECPGNGILFHSDRGSQYASLAFKSRVKDHVETSVRV